MTSNKTIWKYPIDIVDGQTVQLPEGAKILCAQVQNNQLCLWALGNPDDQLRGRTIEIYGTGHPVLNLGASCHRQYIGTVQLGPFVWHVFEVT